MGFHEYNNCFHIIFISILRRNFFDVSLIFSSSEIPRNVTPTIPCNVSTIFGSANLSGRRKRDITWLGVGSVLDAVTQKGAHDSSHAGGWVAAGAEPAWSVARTRRASLMRFISGNTGAPYVISGAASPILKPGFACSQWNIQKGKHKDALG